MSYEDDNLFASTKPTDKDIADWSAPDFQSFPRMPRFSRDIIITEKLDGTNAQIFIDESGLFLTGSRNRWITPDDDNYGFARWAYEHREELLILGPGRHFGEWWGAGIQRRYGMNEKRFSLFNVNRWIERFNQPHHEGQEYCPACCHVVPVLYSGPFSMTAIDQFMRDLQSDGSAAAPGFMNPEGIVIFHTAAKQCFKKTFEHDSTGKPE
jgi:hypothetical protein